MRQHAEQTNILVFEVSLLCCIFVCHAAIPCGPLPLVTGGHYEGNGCSTGMSVYNDTCEVTCDFGYVLRGSQVQRCTLDPEWTPIAKGHCESNY